MTHSSAPRDGPKRPRRLLLGEIAGAHGIRGAVLIKTYTAEPQGIAAYGPLEDETGRRAYEVAVERVTSKGVVGRVAGVSDRTAAEALKGVKLYISRERLPETAEGEFYHADLVGLTAVDGDGNVIGEVAGVVNYGAGDLLEVRLTGARQTELVPLSEAFVPKIDLDRGRVVVLMPAEGAESDDESQG